MIKSIKQFLLSIGRAYFASTQMLAAGTFLVLCVATFANFTGNLFIPIVEAVLMGLAGAIVYFHPGVIAAGSALGGVYAGIPGLGGTAHADVKATVASIRKFVVIYDSIIILILLTLGLFQLQGSFVVKMTTIIAASAAGLGFGLWYYHNVEGKTKWLGRYALIVCLLYAGEGFLYQAPGVAMVLGLYPKAYVNSDVLAKELREQQTIDAQTIYSRDEQTVVKFGVTQKKFSGIYSSDEIIANRHKLRKNGLITDEELGVIERERERRNKPAPILKKVSATASTIIPDSWREDVVFDGNVIPLKEGPPFFHLKAGYACEIEVSGCSRSQWELNPDYIDQYPDGYYLHKCADGSTINDITGKKRKYIENDKLYTKRLLNPDIPTHMAVLRIGDSYFFENVVEIPKTTGAPVYLTTNSPHDDDRYFNKSSGGYGVKIVCKSSGKTDL